MRYFIVAGEASGDLHAANLIKEILRLDEHAEFSFIGGENMSNIAGKAPIAHYKQIAFMGFINVVKHLPSIQRVAKQMQAAMIDFQPDHVVAVDSSSFCLHYLLPFAKKRVPSAIRTYYILPKVWSSRKGRIKKLNRYCDNLYGIFPFEEEFFASEGVKATFVGNPCIEAVGSYIDKHQDSPSMNEIALLPGSRLQEISDNLPLMLETVTRHFPHYKATIAAAPGVTSDFYNRFIAKYPTVAIERDNTYELLTRSKFAIVTSGTATLEAALIGTPIVAIYRSKGLAIINWAFKHLLPIDYITPVNLIVGSGIIKELLATEVTVDHLNRELKHIENNPFPIKRGYTKLRQILGNKHASIEVARNLVGQHPKHRPCLMK